MITVQDSLLFLNLPFDMICTDITNIQQCISEFHSTDLIKGGNTETHVYMQMKANT